MSSDNNYIYSASKDYSYKLWDAKTVDIKTDVSEEEDELHSTLLNNGKHYITYEDKCYSKTDS